MTVSAEEVVAVLQNDPVGRVYLEKATAHAAMQKQYQLIQELKEQLARRG